MTNIPAFFSGEATVKEASILIRESHMKDGPWLWEVTFTIQLLPGADIVSTIFMPGNDGACVEILPVFVVDFMCAFSVNDEGCSYRDS